MMYVGAIVFSYFLFGARRDFFFSTQYFRDTAAAAGRLVCVDAGVIDTGKGNIREILRVSWRDGEAAEGVRDVATAGVGRGDALR